MNTPCATSTIRILLVDDHGVVREALSALLERHSYMSVVGTAADGKEAVRAATQLEPDVVVMDLVLPELSGIDATQRILEAQPKTRVVILSACHTSEHVFRALRAGASGYVLKEAAGGELVRAIDAVMTGERYLGSGITSLVIDGLLNNSMLQSPLESLSSREREVLHLTVAGASSAEIAKRLSLSRATVDTYRSRVMEKLHVTNRSELIQFAIQHALTPAYSASK